MDPKDAAQTEKLITDPENVVLMDLGRSSWFVLIRSAYRWHVSKFQDGAHREQRSRACSRREFVRYAPLLRFLP